MNNEQLEELINDMSLKEKIGQLAQINGTFFDEDITIVTGPAAARGITAEDLQLCGSVLNIHGAKKQKAIQKQFIENHPHRIPLLFMLDVINGYRTIFPIPLAQGCTFDPLISECVASISAGEASAGGIHVTFSPMADLVCDPRWGRVMESTGEDPYLNALFAAAMVRGYQGKMLAGKGRIASCVKHFAGYGAPVAGREYGNVELSKRTLLDDHLPAYKAAVDAGVSMVMTSFSTLDRIPCSANRWLMLDILRKKWGFKKIVISDFAAIQELVSHGIATNDYNAAELAMDANVDIDMVSNVYQHNLEKLFRCGILFETALDTAVLRVLKLKNELGLFENPYKDSSEDDEKTFILCREHRKMAREVATSSFVLLKNEDNILPLSKESVRRCAIIGPYADNKHICGMWSITARDEDNVTVLDGIRSKGIEIAYAQGSSVLDTGYELIGFKGNVVRGGNKRIVYKMRKEAVEVAKKSDIVVLALGEHPEQSGEAGSRADLSLPGCQMDLLKKIRAVNSNIVVVLFCGRPLDLREVATLAKTVLVVWFPGTEGGNAVADVLFGDAEPSGRLAMSFPWCVGQVPISYREFTTGRPYNSSIHKDRFHSKYLDIPNEPLYPFGFGLGYTLFKYGPVNIDKKILSGSDKITATIEIENVGKRMGSTIAQMYIQDLIGSVVRPSRELKGFQKITLAPNERKTLKFDIAEEMLRFHRADMNYISEPGQFKVYIGEDSRTKNSILFEYRR
jgi:beta-glucosidase